MTLTGPFYDFFTFSPFDDLFLRLSRIIYKFTSYTLTGSPVTTRSVPTSHIDPVRGACDSNGTVLCLFFIFTLRWHVFMIKSNLLQIYVVHSNQEPRDYAVDSNESH